MTDKEKSFACGFEVAQGNIGRKGLEAVKVDWRNWKTNDAWGNGYQTALDFTGGTRDSYGVMTARRIGLV